jgi:hypothetical protein
MYLKIEGEKTENGYTITIKMDETIWNIVKPLAKDLLNYLKNPPIEKISTPTPTDKTLFKALDASSNMPSELEEIFEEILKEACEETEE